MTLKTLPEFCIFDFNMLNKNAFQSKAHSRLPIETQTLTILPWNDLDLEVTLI